MFYNILYILNFLKNNILRILNYYIYGRSIINIIKINS